MRYRARITQFRTNSVNYEFLTLALSLHLLFGSTDHQRQPLQQPNELRVKLVLRDVLPVATAVIVQTEPLPMKRGLESQPIELSKEIAERRTHAVRTVVSAKTASKKLAMPAALPDHLIAKAMKLLRDGKPEQALAVLAEYPVQDSMSADVDMVKTLRAQAQAAIAARGK